MKRFTSIIIVICLVISCLSFSAGAVDERNAGNNSRYTGLITMGSSLDISSIGRAYADVVVSLRDGYKATMHVALNQEGLSSEDVVKEWNVSIPDGGDTWAGVYYVASGYFYWTTVTLDVYTTGGRFVETVVLDSNEVYY